MSEQEQPFVHGDEPYAGFEVQVLADRRVYGPGEVVRLTVTATNQADRATVHRYPGWQRFVLTVRDEQHRPVASDEVDPLRVPAAAEPFVERWLPGQMVILPSYWAQTAGPLRPAWSDTPPGPRVAPGRYRARVSWLGREPGALGEVPESFSTWFELT
jgi:hypothetical protein